MERGVMASAAERRPIAAAGSAAAGPSPAAAAGMAPVPGMWTVFVLGWLPVLAFNGWTVLRARLDPPVAVATVLGLLALGALFLWLTLRGALTGADLTPAGPPPAVIRRRLLALTAMFALVIGLSALDPPAGKWWLVMYIIVAAGLALPTWTAAGVGIGLVLFAFASSWLTTGRFELTLMVQVAFAVGAIAIRQLTIAVAQLHDAREELARMAVSEERLRFARDLHDLLGHSLSMIVLKSELAGRLLSAAPARAAAEVGDVERAARDALRQVRAAVAGYRQPALRDELAAARELLDAAGIALTIEHTAGPLPPAIDGLIAWAVRDGVTNVIRHSRARHCTIRVSRLDGWVRVEVTDNGCGGEGGTPPNGNGLTGLAERAAVHDGRLRAGPRPEGGFGLLLEAPAAPAAEAGRS